MPDCHPSHLRTVLALVTCWLLAAGATPAQAQSKYPSRPIQLVIPYPPGGSDVFGRRLAIGMGERLGQTIVVVNKPGASTQIASAFVAAAAPDGHTLYMASPVDLASGPSLFKSLPFDALTDLTPISYVADAPFVLVGTSELPAKSFKDLVAHMKANAGKVRFASYGVQSQVDIVARRFIRAVGVQSDVIPYLGGAAALNAIVRNEVQLLFPTMIPSRSFIVAGKMTPFAVAAESRVPLYPDVPTLKELGVDIVDAAGFGLMGPKGLPGEIVKVVQEALAAELRKPEIRAFIDGLGIVPVASTPEAFAGRLQKATADWKVLAETLNLEKQ